MTIKVFCLSSFSPKQQSALSMEWTLLSTLCGRSGLTCWMWWALTVSSHYIVLLKRIEHILWSKHDFWNRMFFHSLEYFIVVVLSFHSVQPEPLLQPHITHQLSSPSAAPGRRGAGGLLVPLHVPGRLLLPAARRLWPLLLAGAGHALRPVLPLHPAEVWGRPWTRRAAAVLHHGRVFHDWTCGGVLAPWWWGGVPGGEDWPPGHPGQATQYQAEPRHWRPGAPMWSVGGCKREGGGVAAADVRIQFPLQNCSFITDIYNFCQIGKKKH